MSGKPNLISVIMPCFNAENYIEESVKSVLNQTYPYIELIVIDDGSTDSSLKILESIKDENSRLKLFSQQNQGPGPARNKGLGEAKGEFIAFLDSDDWWDYRCLEKLVKALSTSEGKRNDLAYCGWQNIGFEGGRGKPFVPPDYGKGDLSQIFFGGCRWPIHAALVRKTCIEKIGGFNESWTTCMDYDLWLRLSPQIKVVVVPQVMAFYRHHEGEQITKNRARIAENHWKIQKDFIENHPQFFNSIGEEKLKGMMSEELLKRAYTCYWERDLDNAHKIFRMVLSAGFGRLNDWKYIFPALLPLALYRRLIHWMSRG